MEKRMKNPSTTSAFINESISWLLRIYCMTGVRGNNNRMKCVVENLSGLWIKLSFCDRSIRNEIRIRPITPPPKPEANFASRMTKK
jgi:hypothetical protein